MPRIILTLVLLALHSQAIAVNKTPDLRLKVGYIATTFSAGDIYDEEALGSLMTLQPTITWSLPNFRSRVGIHMTLDLASEFGLTPLSGVGLSAYIYPWGISSSHEKVDSDTIIQKSKPGFFVFTSVTPVNFNINNPDSTSTNDTFSSFIIDSTVGAGYDYALKQNIILSTELVYRFGSAANNDAGFGGVNYSGFGLMFSYLTSYY